MIIWRTNQSLSDGLYSEMIESIESNHENKKEFFTTFYDKNNLDVFNNLVPFYGKIISNMMTDLGLEHISRYQYTVWMQMSNSSTTSHKPHAHFTGLESISWVHFANVPSQKCFYFKDSNSNKTYPDQNTGDFIAWPSWGIHGVDQVKQINFDRIICAGNIVLQEYNFNNLKLLSDLNEEKTICRWHIYK